MTNDTRTKHPFGVKVGSKLGNYFKYVFSLGAIGLMVSIASGFVITHILTSFLSFHNIWITFAICSIFYIIADVVLSFTVFSPNSIVNNSTEKSMLFFGISCILNGMRVVPMYLISYAIGFSSLINAFVATVLVFTTISIFVIKSKNDFSSNNAMMTTIAYAGLTVAFVLFLVKLVCFYINPMIFAAIDIISSLIGILISTIMLSMNIGDIKDTYAKFYNNDTILVRLGIVGAIRLIQEFFTILWYVFKLLLYSRKNNNE